MKQTRTPLGAGFLAKGSAVPSTTEADGLAAPNGGSERGSVASVRTSATAYHKALTVKLDEARYRALKLAGLEIDRSSQEILVEALDDWLHARRG